MRLFGPKHLDSREKKGFALFPKRIDNVTIWLESYIIEQSYDKYSRKWTNKYFIDKNK